MSLGDIIERIADAITGHKDENEAQAENDRQFGNVLPASQDPLGDPADQAANQGNFGNVLPASQDPLGDPADQEQNGGFGNVLPASQDPLGDPADEPQQRR